MGQKQIVDRGDEKYEWDPEEKKLILLNPKKRTSAFDFKDHPRTAKVIGPSPDANSLYAMKMVDGKIVYTK